MTTARFLDAAEIADLLGCSVRTVRRRIADGSIASVKIGGLRRVPETAIEQLIRGDRTNWSDDGINVAEPDAGSGCDDDCLQDTRADLSGEQDDPSPTGSELRFNRKDGGR